MLLEGFGSGKSCVVVVERLILLSLDCERLANMLEKMELVPMVRAESMVCVDKVSNGVTLEVGVPG